MDISWVEYVIQDWLTFLYIRLIVFLSLGTGSKYCKICLLGAVFAPIFFTPSRVHDIGTWPNSSNVYRKIFVPLETTLKCEVSGVYFKTIKVKASIFELLYYWGTFNGCYSINIQIPFLGLTLHHNKMNKGRKTGIELYFSFGSKKSFR